MIQSDIARVLAALPVSLDPTYSVQTKALYVPLLAGVLDGVTSTLDIAYGAHPRQQLDLFHVAGSKPSAIVIYVPGGGYTGGDKRSDPLVFANIGAYFARRGMLGITMNYRLSPEFPWPAGAEDVDRVVAWAKANAGSHGADAGRVIVLGHSAGASHCASFLFDPDMRGDTKVAGGILVSGGSYTVSPEDIETRANVRGYFGSDTGKLARRSAASHVPGTKVPVLLACAEHDPGFLVTPTLELAIALTRRDGRCPPLLRLEGHNHFSPPCSFATSDDDLSGAAIRFIKGLK